MSAGNDEFFDNLLSDFLDESSQLLVQLNEDLLQLDHEVNRLGEGKGTRCNDELMNKMFRSAHSIKGLSAMLGLQNINSLTHKVENVFDAARKDQLRLDQKSVELIFSSVDRLTEMIEQLKVAGNDQIDASDVTNAIQSLLQNAGCSKEQKNQADLEAELKRIAQEQAATSPAVPTPAAPTVVTRQPQEVLKAEKAVALEPVAVVCTQTAENSIDLFADIQDESDVSSKYLSIFIDEAQETLDTINETLLNIDSMPPEQANENMLVTSHRLKGSAASLGLMRPAKLAHLMEDVFQDLRETKRAMSSELLDSMFACCDALRNYVEGLKTNTRDTSRFNQLAQALRIAKQNLDSGKTSGNVANSAAVAGVTVASTGEAERRKNRFFSAKVQFEQGLPAAGMKATLICEKLEKFGQIIESKPERTKLAQYDSITEFRIEFETDRTKEELNSLCQLSGVVALDFQEVEDRFTVASESLSSAANTVNTEVSASTEAKIESVEQTSPATASAKVASNRETVAEKVAEVVKSEEKAKTDEKAKGADSKPAETLRVDIERLDQLMNLAGQLVINKARFTQIGESLRSASLSKQTNQVLSNATNTVNLMMKELAEEGKSKGKSNLPQLQSHLHKLQQDLAWFEQEFHRLGAMRNSINGMFEAVHQLDRIADGIQQSVMDTRMVPVGPLFARFKRIVRDITRSTGKQIELEILGEKTELDKRMIDALGDPLIHMVRNSADHGVEGPADRAAAGKSPTGTITLNAYHRGNHIYIEISDDGRGLSKEKIVKKGLEKGLITPGDVDKMTDHQIYQLIWEPGFSTAEKVTEISGRGMGMDIVQAKIGEINGTIDCNSVPGHGTTFTIKLPLTMAILPSLMAVIDNNIFALPVESVIEIVSVNRSAIRTIQGVQTASIRGRVVSVVKLDDIFSWTGSGMKVNEETAEATLVIVGEDGNEIGLMVDSLIGEEDVVIKSLAENYQNVTGIAGASILGSGRVSLILDIPVLLDMAARIRGRSLQTV